MHDDVTAGEREDDGSRMEKFVDTGACEVLAWRCIAHVAGASMASAASVRKLFLSEDQQAGS